MGIVYKARHLRLNLPVALKMIRTGQAAGPHELAFFHREAQAIATLNHPHVVRLYDYGEHNGLPYFSMELVEGGSLAKKMSGQPLPVQQAAQLVETLARAIHAVHERGIIHRDLKPANVLLGPGDSPKIADFGLAKRWDESLELSATGVAKGTASYMAPEQAQGRKELLGPAADIYALGAILYETLTGRPPFRAATRDLTILQVLTEEPIPPSHFMPNLPSDLEVICLKCLDKDIGRRYSSADDLAEDLRRFLDGEAISTRSAEGGDWPFRWARRAGFEILDLMECGRIYGIVYKARQVSLNRLVTLKLIAAKVHPDAEQMAHFRREAEAIARLDHPNIVHIYDFGEQSGQPYIAMEFVEGGSLADKLLDTPYPPQQAVELIQTLARATDFAHQHGIIHCALRPFNVLLTADGVPKVTNFHMARLTAEEQGEAERNKPFPRRLSNYMAPEQASGKASVIGPATDVYALGAMLYELLTGRPPFLVESVEDLLEHLRSRPPAPPSQWQPDLPRSLDMICLRCLEKEASLRYSTAADLAEDLHRFLSAEQVRTDEFDLVPGYEVLEELGRGGLGIVHKARQINLDRLVALKIFNDTLSSANLSHIRAANRALARLSHPNIVQVFDCGERDGLLYIAEELVEGISLDQQSAGRPQHPQSAAELVETLARAMHHAHQQGIVHRNLKPRVVLLNSFGIPKISSFELAKLLDGGELQDEEDWTYVGTPTYMAPEQAAGKVHQISRATDVYALGNILYQILVGRPPFQGDALLDLLAQIRSQQAVPPSRLQPLVPGRLEAICLKCLEKEPGRRYPSALFLAEDLRRFQAAKPWPSLTKLWRGLVHWFKKRE
jgi:serine/threonine protein kinase